MKFIGMVIAILVVMAGCGKTSVAGRGVITETNNVTSARGILLSADSIPLAHAVVNIMSTADSTAWMGVVIASDTTDVNGAWVIHNLQTTAEYEVASTWISGIDTLMGLAYFTVTSDTSIVASPHIDMRAPASITGIYAAFSSALTGLDSSWYLQAQLRGCGSGKGCFFKALDGRYTFTGIPAGEHRLRIERTDGRQGHEVTLWEDWVLAK